MPAISPTGGEIRCRLGFRQSPTLQKRALQAELLISPQVGEMSGRTEGGAVPPTSIGKAIERPPP
ncbi:MAG: propionyl-coenzyme A carboxylase alpha polypeptide [Hyphomicrobiales bacterium]|nr:MAG: propionyl-coenzyme A carboxylase alpha polypeptide [Hyphomicrobiales bacterium]